MKKYGIWELALTMKRTKWRYINISSDEMAHTHTQKVWVAKKHFGDGYNTEDVV